MGKNITVLGAGAWGTAFGQVLADAGNTVTMWAKGAADCRGHSRSPPQRRAPAVRRKVAGQHDRHWGNRAEAVKNADIVVVAIAAQFARVALVEFKGLIPDHAIVVSLMKGIERGTNKRMDEVVRESLDLPATGSPPFPDRTCPRKSPIVIPPPPWWLARTSIMPRRWPRHAPPPISSRS